MLPALKPLLDPPASAVSAGTTVRVECRAVPEAFRAADTLVMPCLGALRTGQILAYHAQGMVVELIDRGWCAVCPAGKGAVDCAGREAVESARLWLESLGETRLPRVVAEPLPQELRLIEWPTEPAQTERLDRRSFFRAAVERPAGRHRVQPTPIGSDGRAAYPAEQRHPSPERERQLSALRHITSTRQQTLPPEMFARITVHDQCCDQRLCVALCPTAALTVADDGQQVHLRFHGEACIACGVCERACPEAALDVQPFGGQPGVQLLVSHQRSRCSSCGDVYTPDAKADEAAPQWCPTCTKTQRFMEDARRQLFGRAN